MRCFCMEAAMQESDIVRGEVLDWQQDLENAGGLGP